MFRVEKYHGKSQVAHYFHNRVNKNVNVNESLARGVGDPLRQTYM